MVALIAIQYPNALPIAIAIQSRGTLRMVFFHSTSNIAANMLRALSLLPRTAVRGELIHLMPRRTNPARIIDNRT